MTEDDIEETIENVLNFLAEEVDNDAALMAFILVAAMHMLHTDTKKEGTGIDDLIEITTSMLKKFEDNMSQEETMQ